MTRLPEFPPSRGRSALATLDTGLLVVVGVVVALVGLKVVGIIAGTIFFLVKLAVLAGVVFMALRLLRSRGR
ncbi:MAG TPA: hypothetical protein VM143_13690 [Acidimicrobiales bacterium]|nr:hypothetical protein [Acidimicrobiales bacterium]